MPPEIHILDPRDNLNQLVNDLGVDISQIERQPHDLVCSKNGGDDNTRPEKGSSSWIKPLEDAMPMGVYRISYKGDEEAKEIRARLSQLGIKETKIVSSCSK